MFHFTTLFIGMDVHKESFSLCYYDMMANQFKHSTKVGPNVSYIVNYVNEVRGLYGQYAEVLCGYEARMSWIYPISPATSSRDSLYRDGAYNGDEGRI